MNTTSPELKDTNSDEKEYFEKLFLQEIDVDSTSTLQSVSSMITGPERALLYLLTKEHFKAEGLIIDAGCFLGGSTVCFAEGLHKNANLTDEQKKSVIKTYDMFKVWTFRAKRYMPEDYDIGDSFYDLFEKNIKGYEAYIDVFKGDLLKQEPINDCVEFLFLDVCKSWDLEKRTRHLFYKNLKPGSLLIQQDFFVSEAVWNIIMPYVMRDYITFIRGVDNTALFLVNKEIPQELIEYDLLKHNFDELTDMLGKAIELYGNYKPVPLILSQAQLFYQFQGIDAAHSFLIYASHKYNLDHQNADIIRAFGCCGHWDR